MPAVPGAAAAPAPLAVNGPAQSLEVPAPPGFTLSVVEAGEYQIDAMGEPMDAELFLYQGDQVVANDRDSGGNSNARIVGFLQPGTYIARVFEYRARPMTVRMQAQKLPPLPSAGNVVVGTPLAIDVPAGSDVRSSCREVTLNVAAPGNFQILAVAAADMDAELDLIQNNAKLDHDSDGGGNRNAKIQRQLAPGAYTLRVWDYRNRAAQITITVTPAS